MIFYKSIVRFVLLIGFVFNFTVIFSQTKDQEIKLTLREIGHEFLLQLSDSTSRVLPIKEINGQYVLQFERTFSFLPGQLIFAVSDVFEKKGIEDSYLIEIQKCGSKEVEHSFEINFNQENPYPACGERELPEACYEFYFTLKDTNQVQENGSIISVKNSVNSINEENVGRENNSLIYVFVVGLLLLILLISVLLIRKRKPKLNSTSHSQNTSNSEIEMNEDMIQIGQFLFNKKNMQLILSSHIVELSGKESDLLLLLKANENKTLEREHILNVVWGDEGDYVGRTLDVFISKLRKKLEADTNIKIINVRGVGYKFVVG